MVGREMRFKSQSGKKGTESEGMRQGGKHTDLNCWLLFFSKQPFNIRDGFSAPSVTGILHRFVSNVKDPNAPL